jgi:hypothetical protein
MLFGISAHWHYLWLVAGSFLAGIMNATAWRSIFILCMFCWLMPRVSIRRRLLNMVDHHNVHRRLDRLELQP